MLPACYPRLFWGPSNKNHDKPMIKNKKEPVHLRQKKLNNGNISLYLDIYVNGRREYEFLKLYLVPEKTKEDRASNRETLRLAEAIKSLRIVDIQNGRYGFASIYKTETNFLEYFSNLTEQLKTNGTESNYNLWTRTLRHLKIFFKENTTFADISEKTCEQFRDYLTKDARTQWGYPLAKRTQHYYFITFKASFGQALRNKIIPENVCQFVSPPKFQSVERVYLTQEELKRAAKAESQSPILKRAFLFSCLTGLRWSDIQKLRWKEVSTFDGHTRLTFTQKKTRELEYLDIADQAAQLLGERGEPEALVFAGLKYNTYTSMALNNWLFRAGIDKKVTFHCARHTFAVLMLDLGVDLYTVQKLLGHREIRTTQIYAHLLDKTKQDAVAKIPDLL